MKEKDKKVFIKPKKKDLKLQKRQKSCQRKCQKSC